MMTETAINSLALAFIDLCEAGRLINFKDFARSRGGFSLVDYQHIKDRIKIIKQAGVIANVVTRADRQPGPTPVLKIMFRLGGQKNGKKATF